MKSARLRQILVKSSSLWYGWDADALHNLHKYVNMQVIRNILERAQDFTQIVSIVIKPQLGGGLGFEAG